MSDRMQRLERQDKMHSIIKYLLILLALAAGMGVLYRLGCQALTALDDMGRDIRVVQYGTMEERVAARAVVLNQEQLYLAREAGRFENLVREKEKVGKGTLLGYFITDQGKTAMRAAQAGVFIRSSDGLEEVFAHLDLAGVTPEVFQYKPSPAFLERPLQEGQAMYKLVDNLLPTRLLISLPADELPDGVETGQGMHIIQEGEDWGQGRIVEMKHESKEVMLLLRLDSFCEKSLGRRYVKMEAVFDTRTGFLVPARAIVEKDGEKGIYCTIGKLTRFKPVRIIKQKDDIVLVDGLDRNDFIVTNPTARI